MTDPKTTDPKAGEAPELPPEEILFPRIVRHFKPGDYVYHMGREYKVLNFFWRDDILRLQDEEKNEISIPYEDVAYCYSYAFLVWIDGYRYPYPGTIETENTFKLWANFCNSVMEKEGFKCVNKDEYEAIMNADEHLQDHVYVQYIDIIWRRKPQESHEPNNIRNWDRKSPPRYGSMIEEMIRQHFKETGAVLHE